MWDWGLEMAEKPFEKKILDEDKNPSDFTFTTRLTTKDKLWFQPAKKFLKQPKNSTAMKQLAEIGAIVVLHDKKISSILDVIIGNSRRNQRLGIPNEEFEKV